MSLLPTTSPKNKLPGNSTIFKIGSTDHEDSTKESFGEWTWVSADTFNVRIGPDYSYYKRKAPSEDALYETVACDVYSLRKKMWHAGRYFDLEKFMSDKKEDACGGLPEILLINVLAPVYAPGFFYSQTDGKGFMVTMILKLSDKTIERIAKGDETPGMKLFKRFVEEASTDPEMRGRLKGIVRASNLDELQSNLILSGFAHRYNCTPFLIHHNEARYFQGDRYFEIDVDMHNWSLISRNAFYQLNHLLKEIRAHFAFVVEGRSNEELPEQILGVTEFFNIRNMEAKAFPFEDEEDSLIQKGVLQ